MAKSKEKMEARRLRRAGESVKVIASTLSVSVGSVSAWVRDIQLTKKQERRLSRRSTDALYGGKKIYLEQLKKLHNEKVFNLRKEGSDQLGKLTERDMYILGLALYWGEGFKKDSLVGLATSDCVAARFFIEWMQRCFGVEKERFIFRITLNVSHRDRTDQIRKYWAEQLNVKAVQFSKTYYQTTKSKKQFENREEYFGVVRIRVRRSVDLLRIILGAIDAISSRF